jgi:hypothetical protein
VFDGAVDTLLDFRNPNQCGMNAAGTLIFLAELDAPNSEDSGIHTSDPALLGQEGFEIDPVTGAELGEILSLNPVPVINNTGATALLGQAHDPVTGETKRAILGGASGEMGVLARAGDTALLGGTLTTKFGQATIGDSGLVIFPDGDGVFIVDTEGHTALRKLVIPDDVARNGEIVSSVMFQSGSGNSDGRPGGFNNAMMPVVQVGFDSGAEGIFLVEVCDLDADGDVDTDDRDAFEDVCRNDPDAAITRCDRDANGFDPGDVNAFRNACR